MFYKRIVKCGIAKDTLQTIVIRSIVQDFSLNVDLNLYVNNVVSCDLIDL